MSEDKLYQPQPGERQLSLRALLVGCSIGALVTAMNLYFGLRTGWSMGGSLIAAILSYSFFQVIKTKTHFGVLETNIAQTAGSAAGSMTSAAGLLAAIPAMSLLGYKLTTLELFIWALSVAYIGVFFAVPLRKQMVVIEKLRFPTGTATAETIMAVFAKGDEALRKSKTLLYIALFSALLTLASYFISPLGHPPIMNWLGLGVLAAWGFSVLISPMMFGAGILIGPRIGLSLLIGAVLSWGIVGPTITELGWVSDKIMDYETGARGWLLWPGVSLMVTDAFMSLILSYKTIVKSFKKVDVGETEEDLQGEGIGPKVWLTGLALSSLALVLSAWFVFEIHPLLTLLAIALSSVLSVIAVRSTGETDINPIGGMGKVTQLVFGALSPGNVSANLMTAGITGAGASQAGDMMQDLKTGYMLGASPIKQFKAQCIGIFVGVLVCVPVFKLFDTAYTIGEGDLPAPAAHAWKAMAQLLSQGFDVMPAHAFKAVFVAALFGIAMSFLKLTSFKKWIPSGLAIGIAFIVPAYYSIAMFVGSLFYVWWQKRNASQCESLSFAVASGLVAGEGLMGVIVAILTLIGIKPLI